MKKIFDYGWLIKWILAAILMAGGILAKLYELEVVYATTGIAIVLFSILRIYPLMKTLKKEVLRTINLFEIFLDVVVGALMIFVVFSGRSNDAFWKGLYGYLIAFFFYVRGFIYFISMYFFQEKSEAMKFWFHLIALSLGSALLVLAIFGQDILSFLGWIVLFISVAGGVYLGYDGYGGYRIYRQNSKTLQEQKAKKAPVEKELPKPQPQPEEQKKETYIN